MTEFNFGGSPPAGPAGAAAEATGPAAPALSRRPPLPLGTRRALGLPAGSIRALLAFLVLGLIWGLMALQKEVPIYLQYLMFMVLGHYFAAHHRTIKPVDERERSPLFLPRGAIRFLIFLGFVAVVGAIYYQNRNDVNGFLDDLKMKDERTRNTYVPVVLVLAFFFGLIVARFGMLIGGKDGQPGWYQDVQAWLVLLAAFGLVAVIVIELVVNPDREAEGQAVINVPPHLNQILASIVGFYFGARS